jgi:hypothetical protein
VKFLDTLDKHWSILNEQEPVDAAMPAPNATDAEQQQIQVAPEGYVDMVRLLIKATAMNFPAGSLDELYRTNVTKENAFVVQKVVEVAMKQYANDGDNQERLDNPHYQQFLDSVNPHNFIDKLKQIESIIKKQDPYAK